MSSTAGSVDGVRASGQLAVGYIDYAFDGDRADIHVVEPAQLINHNLGDFPEAYGH